jgi:hypothetical protein
MKIVLPTLHVRRSPQAVPLAAANLVATLVNCIDSDCELLDFFPDNSAEEISLIILSCKPDMVAIPLYSWNRQTMLDVSLRLKQKNPSIILIAGGPEATADPDGVIQQGKVDAVIQGEGEITFREVIELFSKSGQLTLLPGLSLSTDSGIQHGPKRPFADPEELPSPWLTGVLRAEQGVLWEVARGCPFQCSYCFDGLGSTTVRTIPTARLAAELDLFSAAGVDQLWVLDSSFNVPTRRGKELLSLLAGRAPDIHVHLEAKIEHLDSELIQMTALLPCSIQVGLQSTQPQVLRAIHRPLNIELYTRQLRELSEAGVTFGIDLIFGLPLDDLSGFRDSLTIALSFRPNHIDLFPLAVLPGTKLFDQKAEYGIIAETCAPYRILSSDSWSTADLDRAYELAAAADLFYNLGRAVGFFEVLLQTTGLEPVQFLEKFANWMMVEQGVFRSVLLDAEQWRPEEILPMQEGFIQHLLINLDRNDLMQAALDLIRYHFHYAESLLGGETLPLEEFPQEEVWTKLWRLAPDVRLVPFSYEILDLLEMGEVDLEEFTDLFRPVGSMALFMRQGEEILCESLEEDFSTLLRGCDGTRSPEQIFSGAVSKSSGSEVVRFAIAEGMLIPAEEIDGADSL